MSDDITTAGADVARALEIAADTIADRIESNFTSPCVSDSELGPANMVDVLHDIARAGFSISRSIRLLAQVAAGRQIDWDDPRNEL